MEIIGVIVAMLTIAFGLYAYFKLRPIPFGSRQNEKQGEISKQTRELGTDINSTNFVLQMETDREYIAGLRSEAIDNQKQSKGYGDYVGSVYDPMGYPLFQLGRWIYVNSVLFGNLKAEKAYRRGICLVIEGYPFQALDEYLKAIESNPDDAKLWKALGDLFVRSIPLPQRAEQLYERAIRLNPKHAQSWIGLEAGKPPI